jgi:plastocyanin
MGGRRRTSGMYRLRAALAATLCAVALSAAANAAPTPAPSELPADAVVHIKDFAYKPPTVTIHTGQTVLFVNDDSDAHTVTADDKSFDSGGLDTNERWRHTFTKPGKYAYFCALHPYMKAVVVVTGDTPKKDTSR